jgi:hypothetical protein
MVEPGHSRDISLISAFEGHITHFGPDVVFRSPNPAGQPAGCNGVYHWILLDDGSTSVRQTT